MQYIYQITYAFLFGWFISSFTPIHGILNLIILKLEKAPLIKLFVSLLYTIVQCHKCAAFWSGLALTQDIYLSLIASFAASIYSKHVTI